MEITLKYMSEWQWKIGKETLRVGMVYGRVPQDNTYFYHLTAPEPYCDRFGFIHGFGYPNQWEARRAGVQKYKEITTAGHQ